VFKTEKKPGGLAGKENEQERKTKSTGGRKKENTSLQLSEKRIRANAVSTFQSYKRGKEVSA